MVRSARQGAIPDDYAALIQRMDDLLDRVKTLEQPSGEAMGNTLPRTNANVEELLARATYSAEDTYALTAPLGTTLPYTTPDLASIPFTLTEKRRVRLQGSCFTGLFAWNDGGAITLDPHVVLSVRLGLTRVSTGVTTYTTSPTETGTSYIAGAQTITRWSGRPFLEDYRDLEADDWILSWSVRITRHDGIAGTIQVSQAKSSVQVLEKAA